MHTFRQRDIVLVPFPFSDLSTRKVRPVLVLSNNAYNRRTDDILACGLTTNLKTVPYSVIVDPSDVETPGSLRHRSKIRADAIVSLDQSLIIKQIARVNRTTFANVVAEIVRLIRV